MQGVTVNLSVSIPLQAGKPGLRGENMRRLKGDSPGLGGRRTRKTEATQGETEWQKTPERKKRWES